MNARQAGKSAVKAVARGEFRQAYNDLKEMVSEVKQSDEAQRLRRLLARRD